MSERSTHGWGWGCGNLVCSEHRRLLKAALEQAGFESVEHEWWHHQWPGAAPDIKGDARL